MGATKGRGAIRERVVKLWDDGHSRKEIARALVVSREAVTWHLRVMGLGKCACCGSGLSRKVSNGKGSHRG